MKSLEEAMGTITMPSEIEFTKDEILDSDEYTTNFKLIHLANKRSGDLDSSIIDCLNCLNRGYVYIWLEETDGQAIQHCKCLKTREAVRNGLKSGLGNLLDHRVNNFKVNDDWQRDFKQLATDYILNARKEWFMAMGQSGTGKTMLCSAICNDRLNKGYEVVYLLWRDYVASLKKIQFDDKKNDKRRYFVGYADAEILYIDDLFKGTVTDTDKSYAFELINHRYNKGLVTIISSELLVLKLADKDQATAGRMKELAGKYCFQIEEDINKNYRLK